MLLHMVRIESNPRNFRNVQEMARNLTPLNVCTFKLDPRFFKMIRNLSKTHLFVLSVVPILHKIYDPERTVSRGKLLYKKTDNFSTCSILVIFVTWITRCVWV